MSVCKSCGAPIMWRTNRITGKKVPVDAKPVEGGNVKLISATDVIVAAKGSGTHVLHFVACPDAAKHRGRKRS